MRFWSWPLIPFFLIVGAPVSGDDVALYDAPLPDDAAFVRFINVTQDATVFDALVTADQMNAPDFIVLRADTVEGMEAGAFYTVLPDATESTRIVTEPARDPARVMVALINLSDTDLTLRTADGSIEIVAPVKPQDAGYRSMNPVQVPVAVFAGNEIRGEVLDLNMRRGQHPAVVVTNTTVSLINSDVATEPLK